MTFANGKFFTSADLIPLDPDPFCASLPYQLLFWNNSAWQNAAHCPRHHWYTDIRGLRHNGGSVHLDFGSLIHEGADIYSKAVAAGATTEAAAEFALGHVLAQSWPVGEPLDVFGGHYGEVWQCPDRTRTNSRKGITRCPWSKAEHLADKLAFDGVCPGCARDVDRRIAYLCPEKIKNRRTLARTIVALCDQLTAGSVKPRVLPDGRIGAEYRWFRELEIWAPGAGNYTMTGTFDGVDVAPTGDVRPHTVFPEYKTTQREPDAKWWTGYEMSPQIHTYTWGGQGEFGSGTRVRLYAIHIGVGFTEIYSRTVYLSPGSLKEWESELGQKIQEFELRATLAAQLEARDEDPMAAYPRNLAGCNSLPGAPTTPCPFRDYCRLDPGDREAFLASNFHVEHHNPLGVTTPELVEEGA